jgi:dTMP kinase
MFITLEGIEGSGKTTQIRHILAYLRQQGQDAIATREPGGTAIGSHIRRILLDPSNANLTPGTELLLYTADRVQHVHQLISPALAKGQYVICDRYFDATMVYQGYARGVDKELISTLYRLMLGDLMPDLTLLLDLSVKTGLRRAWRRISNSATAETESRFENEDLSFHERVRAGYLQLARQEPNRFCLIDAGQDETSVWQQIKAILSARRESR